MYCIKVQRTRETTSYPGSYVGGGGVAVSGDKLHGKLTQMWSNGEYIFVILIVIYRSSWNEERILLCGRLNTGIVMDLLSLTLFSLRILKWKVCVELYPFSVLAKVKMHLRNCKCLSQAYNLKPRLLSRGGLDTTWQQPCYDNKDIDFDFRLW